MLLACTDMERGYLIGLVRMTIFKKQNIKKTIGFRIDHGRALDCNRPVEGVGG